MRPVPIDTAIRASYHSPSPSIARFKPRTFLTPRAAAMSVYVIRAFVKMREDLVANAGILKRLAEIDKELLIHDSALRDIYQKLQPLLAPPPEPPKTEIGFHIREDSMPYRVKRKVPRPRA